MSDEESLACERCLLRIQQLEEALTKEQNQHQLTLNILEKALRFYADEKNWEDRFKKAWATQPNLRGYYVGPPLAELDKGEKARAALSREPRAEAPVELEE